MHEFDQLRQYVSKYVHIEPAVFEEASRYFKPRFLKKGEYLYREGGICHKLAFVLRGLIRSFYHIEGEEVTRFIVWENFFVTAFSSFISRKSSNENIQAIEDSHVLVICYEDLQHLYRKHPSWQELGRRLVEESHLRLEQRVLSLLTHTAEQRYRALAITQPELLRRVPLQYIASLLGIKPETLSRIRRKVRA
ncbi:MAG: Crp/Fnr family transcriptional regulator [Bacteroidetes bacterium]|nr:MAG: Crp/Fnr family transcriptional regulator [Bacteroidota bacterium]